MTASKRLLTSNISTIPTTPRGACLGTRRLSRIQIRREYLKITSYCVKILSGKNLQRPSQPSTTHHQRRTQVRSFILRTSFLAKSIIPIFWKSKTSSPYLSEELITIARVTNSMGDFKTSIWVKIVSCLTTYLLAEFTRCKLLKNAKAALVKILSAWSSTVSALPEVSIVVCTATAPTAKTIAKMSKSELRLSPIS